MNVLADAGFWYALYDDKDPYSPRAQDKALYIELATIIIIPWPILYETVNTKFAKRQLWMDQFERMLTSGNAKYLDDSPYRDSALRIVFNTRKNRPMSVCDMVLRQIIEDVNVRVEALLTFNEKDFFDVCRARRVQIL